MYLPLNRGHISQIERGPSPANWPMLSSKYINGRPHTTMKIMYGTRNAPEYRTYIQYNGHDMGIRKYLQYNGHDMGIRKYLQYNGHDMGIRKYLPYNGHDMGIRKYLQYNGHDMGIGILY